CTNSGLAAAGFDYW
nr:immunoglobulin heavy chain junction region [Macaca mulatta]MOW25048.1 immunoglobulin heavy chain junction region [Macaca mulatta]